MEPPDLVARVLRLRAGTDAPRLLVGIAGAPGAGKTTLALDLVARLGGRCGYVPLDGFHLADRELDRLGRRNRKGAPDTFDPRGLAALLARVVAGETAWAPAFDRRIEQPVAQSLPLLPEHDLVVVEGNYLLLSDPDWAAVRTQLHETWYLRLADDVRQERLVERHVEFGKEPERARQWVADVDEVNARLVARSAAAADLVVELGPAAGGFTTVPR